MPSDAQDKYDAMVADADDRLADMRDSAASDRNMILTISIVAVVVVVVVAVVAAVWYNRMRQREAKAILSEIDGIQNPEERKMARIGFMQSQHTAKLMRDGLAMSG
jgi:type IV secretory pathway VirB3-like protein